MKLWGILLLFASSACFAAGSPCPSPEYAQLSGAGKAELRDAYCSAMRRFQSNEKMHQITQDLIQEKSAIPADVSQDQQRSMEELKAANTCRSAAGAFGDALSRRFKDKPPSCN